MPAGKVSSNVLILYYDLWQEHSELKFWFWISCKWLWYRNKTLKFSIDMYNTVKTIPIVIGVNPNQYG